MTVNKCILIGNLGKDAELRTTSGGMQVASLRLATTDRRKDASGQWTDHTEWHSVVCFDKLAALMERFGKKGKPLYVEGRIQTREYTDKDGQKRWSTEIIAGEIRLLGGREDSAGASADRDRPEASHSADRSADRPQRSAQTARAPAKAEADDYGGYDDQDVPF
jgi:single-strand DNA-binding protein